MNKILIVFIIVLYCVNGIKWCQIDEKRIKCFEDNYNGKCDMKLVSTVLKEFN